MLQGCSEQSVLRANLDSLTSGNLADAELQWYGFCEWLCIDSGDDGIMVRNPSPANISF